MEPFTPFLTLLAEIEDPRRAEGKLYRLPHVMLFAIMAIVAGANSYRTIHTFIDVHLARLREAFHLPWRRAPAYTTIRGIIQQVEADSIEQVFRRHAAILHEQTSPAKQRPVAIDGKVLRRSFDGFHDRKAAHILSAFATDAALVLAHADCDDKSNEIPAVQTLLSELGLAGALMTVDALHCQKKHSSRLRQPALTSSPRSRPISLPCTSALPNCASVRHLWIRPRQRIRSGDPAMKSVWSRCLLPAPPWPTPNGPITSRRSSAAPATRSSASPRPPCGRDPARSPTSLPTSPGPPQPALTLSAAIGGSKTGCTMSAMSASARTTVGSAATLASSLACDPSPPTSSASTTCTT